MKYFLASAIILIAVVFGGIYFYGKYFPTSPVVDKTKVITNVVFNCDGNKNIHAVFFDDRVELTLSDGRNLLLSQALSASGTRYANNDESFVFWNKGNTAFVEESKNDTYKNCLAI